MIEKVDVKSLNLKELEEFLLSLGEKKFRAKQIYEWMHIHHVTSFDEMTNLSKYVFLPRWAAVWVAGSVHQHWTDWCVI